MLSHGSGCGDREGICRAGGAAAGVLQPPPVPVFPFAAAQVIHERNSPGAKFIIFLRIIKGGEGRRRCKVWVLWQPHPRTARPVPTMFSWREK